MAIAIAAPAESSPLVVTSIDYGDPTQPSEHAPKPGEKGSIFFTLKNQGTLELKDLILQGTPGQCIEELSPRLRLDSLGPQQARRVDSPLSIVMSPECSLYSTGDVLLQGTYLGPEGRRKPIWATHSLVVGGLPPLFDQEKPRLDLTIPESSEGISLEFDVTKSFLISEIGVEFTVQHAFWSDLQVALVSPSGKRVILYNQVSGRGTLKTSFGWEGTAQPAQSLAQLKGHLSAGKWKIQFLDLYAGGIGKILQARLRMKP